MTPNPADQETEEPARPVQGDRRCALAGGDAEERATNGRSVESAPLPAAGARPAYTTYVQPRLGALLECFGLDALYTRGEGPWLWGELGGKQVRVLDFAGGFGATLLGHNPSALVEEARRSAASAVPAFVQASYRGHSGLLAERISRRIAHAVGGGEYNVHLLSTGSEAVEAAVKHCTAARRHRLLRAVRRAESDLSRLRRDLAQSSDDSRSAFADGARGIAPPFADLTTPEQVIDLACRNNRALFDTPPIFVALERSFHGCGSAGTKLTWRPRHRDSMEGAGIDVRFVPPAEPAAFAALLSSQILGLLRPSRGDRGPTLRTQPFPRVAALFIEPIQGEGGVHPIERDHLAELQSLCRRHAVPLVADEIQTGCGRTGAFLASESLRLAPDLVLLSKALGGGMAKIAAIAIARGHYLPDFGLMHVSTFAEDEPSSRIALRTLELLDDDTLARIDREGNELLRALEKLRRRWPRVIRDLRGRGLLIGLELDPLQWSSSRMLRVMGRSGGLAVAAAGWLLRAHQVRLAPALSDEQTLRIEPCTGIGRAEIEMLIAALDQLCSLLDRSDVTSFTQFIHGERPMKSLPRVAGHTLTASQALPRQQGLNGNGVQTNPPTPQSLSTPRHDRPRIAFLTHLIGPDSLRHFDPGLADLSDPALRRFSERVRRHPWMIDYYDFTLRSPTGAAVDASLVGWLTFPEHFAHATASGGGHHFVPLMHEAIDELVAEGVHWIGLGGFTSIVSAAGRRLVRADAHITTGNSLTVAMGLEALAAAARERHIDLRSATVAVVGALGNVGRTYSELLADSVGELILVGRPSNDSRLAHFAESLLAKQQGGAGSTRIRWTTDPAELRSAQAILSASNAPSPIIHPDHVGRAEVIISDVALPGDVSPAVAEERPNATLIRGGIVRLPSEGGESPVDLPGFQLQPGQCYACLAETLLLALEGWHEDYSCGPISALAVRRIAALASRHRFELDSPKISHST